jgi:ssDNA-binding Zn-finger/Zn-ribbon topoisomerase 1
MSLKCSIFGHDFADPEIEREREEQGSEVVITITETETCQRCGETRVVSENKEVTSLETPSDIVGDELVDEPDETAGASEATGEQAPGTDEAELIDEGDQAEQPPASGSGSPDTADVADAGPEPSGDAGEDDAVILDEDEGEDDASGERPPGEWPDEEDDSEEEDAVTVEGDRPPGEWPDEEDDSEDDWAPDIERDFDPEEERPDIEPTGDAITVPEGEFYCPECGFTTEVESSSLREGDFCPECHRGTLTQQTSEE